MVALDSSPVAILQEEYTLVRTSDIYVALTVDTEPTPEDYEKLRQQTHAFFVLRLKKVFPEQFVKLELQLAVTAFGAEKADPKYNVYVEWDIQASFASSTSNMPSSAEMCKSLLTGVDYFDYLVSSVRTIEDSVFSQATAVAAEQRKGALM